MTNRWLILWVLFCCRTMMAFQFQSVAALSPIMIESYAISIVDIGILIGLYLGPGVLIAIPGGSIAAKFGDKRVVTVALVAMVAGLALMAIATGLTGLIVGRVLAGVGGVIVNVIMTKMVVDWFSGAELATAMSILISSWPFGIALALLVLPALASWGGIAVAWAGGTALTLLALLLFVAIYRPAPTSHQGRNSVDLAGLPLLSLGLAGAIWAVYNAALAMVFGFGPILLTENGMSASAGSGIISMFTIFVGLGIFLGGLLVDRFGRRDMFISASFLLSAALLPGLLVAPSASLLWLYALTGFVFGLSAGPVMTLPSEVLVPQARALGMGLFFAIYYGVMMIGPAIGGRLAESTGSTAATFLLASVMLVGCSLALAAFLRESKRQPAA